MQRAQIVLACADGEAGAAIARRLGVNKNTVGKWRRRYAELGIEGLHDELRPGRPRRHDDERVAAVVNAALQTRPEQQTPWSVRAMEGQPVAIVPCPGSASETNRRWGTRVGTAGPNAKIGERGRSDQVREETVLTLL